MQVTRLFPDVVHVVSMLAVSWLWNSRHNAAWLTHFLWCLRTADWLVDLHIELLAHKAISHVYPGAVNVQKKDTLKLWSLERRRVRSTLIKVYKVVHGLSAIPFSTLFEFDTSSRTRGRSSKLRKRRCRLDLRLTSSQRKWCQYGTVWMISVRHHRRWIITCWDSELRRVGLWTSVFRNL